MGRCRNCGLETPREFCDACAEYVAPPTVPPEGRPPPGPVLPGPPLPRPAPPREQSGRERRFDDVRCRTCGRWSPAGATFCGYCDGDIEPAPVVRVARAARRPWWRAVRRPVTRGAAATAMVVAFVAAAVLLAAVVAGAIVRGGAAVRDVLTARYEPVRPVTAAGPAAPQRQATLLVDGLTDTSWAAPAPRGAHAVLVGFAVAVDVDRIGLTQGAGDTPEAYARYARPALVALEFDDGTRAVVRLVDKPGFQTFAVRARGVRSVRLSVVATYPGTVPTLGAALSEVEAFRLV